jgi:hypothetical protein
LVIHGMFCLFFVILTLISIRLQPLAKDFSTEVNNY